MGYKSAIRSVKSSVNKAVKEVEKQQRQQGRAKERLHKKAVALDDKKESIMVALRQEYASGKITQEKFNELKIRENDISLELLILGKSAGAALAKRYVCGKIDKPEFEQIKKEILPAGYFVERNMLLEGFLSRQKALAGFRQQCNPAEEEGICQKCGVKKGFFKPVNSYDNLLLCGKCKEALEIFKNYPGFKGEYIMTPAKVLEGGEKVQVLVKPEYW